MPGCNSEQPWSCLTELVNNYMNCDDDIPEDKRKAAYQAYTDVAGLKPINLKVIFETISSNDKVIINTSALYVYLSIIITAIVLIWVAVAVMWMHWYPALILSVLIFAVFYSACVFSRITVNNDLLINNTKIQEEILAYQFAYENSIAYLPQALLAASCAVVNGTGAWMCNDNGSETDSNCSSDSKSTCSLDSISDSKRSLCSKSTAGRSCSGST